MYVPLQEFAYFAEGPEKSRSSRLPFPLPLEGAGANPVPSPFYLPLDDVCTVGGFPVDCCAVKPPYCPPSLEQDPVSLAVPLPSVRTVERGTVCLDSDPDVWEREVYVIASDVELGD